MPLHANFRPTLPGWTVKRSLPCPFGHSLGRAFSGVGIQEFKQKLNSGMLWEGSRAVSVGKHEVLLKEDATVIRQRMDALFKSLVSMLKTALLKSKGRFDEEELRAVFAEHGMDVPSAKRFIGSLLESRTEEGAASVT